MRVRPVHKIYSLRFTGTPPGSTFFKPTGAVTELYFKTHNEAELYQRINLPQDETAVIRDELAMEHLGQWNVLRKSNEFTSFPAPPAGCVIYSNKDLMVRNPELLRLIQSSSECVIPVSTHVKNILLLATWPQKNAIPHEMLYVDEKKQCHCVIGLQHDITLSSYMLDKDIEEGLKAIKIEMANLVSREKDLIAKNNALIAMRLQQETQPPLTEKLGLIPF